MVCIRMATQRRRKKREMTEEVRQKTLALEHSPSPSPSLLKEKDEAAAACVTGTGTVYSARQVIFLTIINQISHRRHVLSHA